MPKTPVQMAAAVAVRMDEREAWAEGEVARARRALKAAELNLDVARSAAKRALASLVAARADAERAAAAAPARPPVIPEGICEPCQAHYGDAGVCDLGTPSASVHRVNPAKPAELLPAFPAGLSLVSAAAHAARKG